MPTPEQISQILSRPDLSCRALAERVGISKSSVNVIQRSIAGIDIGKTQVVITRKATE
jgi:DNA-binding Xre family transcriptional regulator